MARTISGFDTISSGTTAGVKIQGRTDGAAATTGYVGQIIESTQTATNVTNGSGNFESVTSISLTAGVWLLTGYTRADRNGATITSASYGAGFGTTTNASPNIPATLSSTSADLGNGVATFNSISSAAAPYIYAISATTTVYLIQLNPTFSVGTPQKQGRLNAIRIA